MQRAGDKSFLSPNHYTRTAEGEKELKEEKPGSQDQQRAKHQNPGDAEAVMTSIVFLENTQGFAVWLGVRWVVSLQTAPSIQTFH